MSSDPFEVTELAPGQPDAVREAALMHARGDTLSARGVLEAAVVASSELDRPWHLLLELERMSGRWTQYEALVARYRMRFGEDPPTERDRHLRESRLPDVLRPGGAGCVSLGGALDASQMAALASLRAAADRHPVVHLDLSRLTSAEAVGCGLLRAVLQDLVTSGTGLVLTGAEAFARCLVPLLGQRPALTAAWELQLLTLRHAQDRERFERTALEYALAANVAAPAWEALPLPQAAQPATAERREEPRYTKRESLRLTGNITGAEDPQLVAFAEYAAVNQYVNLDVSCVDRMDPLAAQTLAGIVEAAAAQSRTVRLIRPNQLVAVLFELLNLGRSATIVGIPKS
jgi:anti-anti-sigma regulatory factor